MTLESHFFTCLSHVLGMATKEPFVIELYEYDIVMEVLSLCRRTWGRVLVDIYHLVFINQLLPG